MKISPNHNLRQLFVSLLDYIGCVLVRFNMQSTKFASTPLPISAFHCHSETAQHLVERGSYEVGTVHTGNQSLMYVMVVAQPDIAHAVRVDNRFMHNPVRSHWNAVKHVFRCLVGTKDYGILFGPNDTSSVVGYTDSDFASYVDIQKSTTRYNL